MLRTVQTELINRIDHDHTNLKQAIRTSLVFNKNFDSFIANFLLNCQCFFLHQKRRD